MRRQNFTWTNDELLWIGFFDFSEILIKSVHSGKCTWKFRLQNGSHFVSASTCKKDAFTSSEPQTHPTTIPPHAMTQCTQILYWLPLSHSIKAHSHIETLSPLRKVQQQLVVLPQTINGRTERAEANKGSQFYFYLCFFHQTCIELVVGPAKINTFTKTIWVVLMSNLNYIIIC